MSISHSLSNALSGLTAASRMAEVVSSNLSNVLTDGYGRRSVDLSAKSVGGRSAGVQIDAITRNVDKPILAERRIAQATLGKSTVAADAALQLERVIGAPGNAGALPARIDALEAALQSTLGEPSSELRLGLVVDQFNAVARTFNEIQSGIQRLREEADASIANQIGSLNSGLAQVEKLNASIMTIVSSGGDASALVDQRQAAIDRIADIVPIKELPRSNGRVALFTPSGEVLLDGKAASYGFDAVGTIVPHMTLAVGMLSGVTRNGVEVGTSDGFGKLSGGTLEASFQLRDATLTEAQSTLDAVARNLLERFSDPAVDPSLVAGGPALFTDGGFEFDPLNTNGLAGRITLNKDVDPAQGGEVFRLRDGVASAVAGPVGETSQLNRWIGALADPIALHTGGVGRAISGLASDMAAAVSNSRVDADEQRTFGAARWGALRESELAGGVDSDQEMQLLLRIEQAYAANARVIETIDAMIRRLMEI